MYGCTRILKWKSLKLSSGEVYVNRWKGRDGDGKRRKRKEKREQRTQAFRVKEGEKNGCIATGWKGSVFTRLVGVDGTRVSAERSSIEVEDWREGELVANERSSGERRYDVVAVDNVISWSTSSHWILKILYTHEYYTHKRVIEDVWGQFLSIFVTYLCSALCKVRVRWKTIVLLFFFTLRPHCPRVASHRVSLSCVRITKITRL